MIKRLLATILLAATPVLPALATPNLSNGRPGPTPYDQYLGPVSTVLHHLDGSSPSFERVSALVREGFGFKYVFDTPYTAATPAETEARHAGDCKAKSLWLASEMNDPSIRYVIGKARRTSTISHAWLMWKHNGHWWILDPTNSARPILAENTGPDEYLVTYSYDKNGSYRHTSPYPYRRAVAGPHRRRVYNAE